jgi:hypothetical protein
MVGINVFDPRAYLVAMAFFAAVVALSILAPDAAPFVSTPAKRCSMSGRHDRFGMPPSLIEKNTRVGAKGRSTLRRTGASHVQPCRNYLRRHS